MLISFGNFRVDARDLDHRRDTGALGVLAIDINGAAEFVKLTSGGTEKMSQLKSDLGVGRIELVGLALDR